MLLRAFQAHDGTRWEVWEAHPKLLERRSLSDRRAIARETAVRRQRPHGVLPDDTDAALGWLVFRSENARRRQQPIPPNWDKLDEHELASLLKDSRPSGPRSRVTG